MSLIAVPCQASGTYHVDRSNASCSDLGPGTGAQPYCTISAAVAARGAPGTVILVEPGVYREQVTFDVSGTVSAPLELRAAGAGVVIDGADDYSGHALWIPYAGDVWLAADVIWPPRQVFADGTRLSPSSAAPESLPPRTFRWVSGDGLYANAGGGSPADHQAKVGHRAHGFLASGRSGLTLDGFAVTRTEDRGIYLPGECENVTVTDNVVTFAGRAGIQAVGGFGLLLGSNVVSDNGDHGIALTGGVSAAVIEDNESCRNANPIQGGANGIHIAGGRGITVRRNRLHVNQNTGLHLQSGSNNLSCQNLSWNNGGQGYDHVGATLTTHVCDVAYGNLQNGFSIQNRSTGTRIYDSISSDNGPASGFDLWIDAGSVAGLASNYNLFWNSNGQPTVRYATGPGSSVTTYAASSGQDAQTLESDPRFVNPAMGDFDLQPGSPAIDAASSAVPRWPATDAQGGVRRDDWASANTGTGPVAYADRGAFEFTPLDRAPVVVAPAAIAAPEGSPLSITVHAADPDGDAIGSLTADLSGLPPGNDAVFLPGPGDTTGMLTWTPTYADSGIHPVTFTAANALNGSAATSITVTDVYQPYPGSTFYVDVTNPHCSSHGPGTPEQPYCEIDEALEDQAGPGVAIIVKPGVYRERVTISASGTADSPMILHADGNVVVDGADDFSDPALWTQVAGDVWVAASVSWTPLQVFADGARLAPSSAAPASLPPRTFRYTAGGLYVNAGGGHPAGHQLLVGRRKYAFVAYAEEWITIEGFTVLHTEDRGIYMGDACANIKILHNTVRFANRYGIQASGGDSFLIGSNVVSDCNDHGISITTGVSGSIVEDNESYRNARPSERAANGIYVHDSSDNLFRRNRLHDNQDTGLHFQAGADDNICYLNRSWNNGDHGYDHLGATGTLHVCDVAYGNYKDGFSIEGTSPGTRIYNSIAVNNGLTTNEFDLWVENSSIAGFESNHNLFWNSTSQGPVKYILTIYSSVAAYSAVSGQDQQSLQADPRFVSPAAGDFHLNADSPAIDAGDSGVPNWPAIDVEGRARVDDPLHPNGVGPVPYSDLGALEYRPALLTVAPATGTAPLAVTADASGSLAPDSTAVAYRFDFGDGTVVGPQGAPTASHSYAAGNWTATVTVTGANGGTSAAAAAVAVSAPPADHAPSVTAPATASAVATLPLTISVTTGDADGDSIASLSADLSHLPPGNDAVFVADAGDTSGTLHWTPTAADTGSYDVTFTAANALVGSAATTISVHPFDAPPDTTARNVRAGAARAASSPGDGVAAAAEEPVLDLNSAQSIWKVRWGSSHHDEGASVRYPRLALRYRDREVAACRIEASVDGVAPIEVWFDRTDLRKLLAGLAPSRKTVTAIVIGERPDGTTQSAPLTFDVVGAPAPLQPIVTPNPMRQNGVIGFATSRRGLLQADLFDATGRRVRCLAGRAESAAGWHDLALDGRDGGGSALPAGVYFYRIVSVDGVTNGRLVLLR